VVSRAFDDAMASAGGSLPVWLVLLSVKTQSASTQRELATAVGIQGATLTHHLNAMEADGLLTRSRNPVNRRIHQVALTTAGEHLFQRLAGVAAAFDAQLRSGLRSSDIAALNRLLESLRANTESPEP
jgi:MarR family transcriptional regulator, transcriptional regulator for hemolysin